MTSNRNPKVRAVAGGAVALGLLVVFGGCADEHSAHPPRNDVDTGWTCARGADVVRASGTVTNHSSQPSSYVVTVEFWVDGVSVDRANTSVDRVGHGETARVEVASDIVGSSDVDCVVADVARFRA